ncbi:MAG: DUF58 domain-containing protein [Phycisphaerae bacterium]|nr:DUF58 domain-containing protein [Phycisphaerae bacterium]
MPTVTDYLHPSDLARLGNLQLVARRVVEGFCSGLHRSPHKGFSVEFKQHRQYVPGDDLRFLDWKIFGKTDRFFIREYEEETNVRGTLVVDASGSMGYEGSGVSKHHYATRLAASLGYLMLQQQDSVGLVTFDTKVRKYLPPRGRPAHLSNIIDTLDASGTGGETELGSVFHDLVPKIHRRGLVIIISDCFGDVAQMMRALAHLRHARHDILIFQIWDPDELEFPFRNWTRFDSLELSDHRLMIDPVHLRNAYMDNLEKYRAELKQGCHRHRIDLVPMTTAQPYAEALAYYLALRKRMK